MPKEMSDLDNDMDYVSDPDYVHTDNNFTDADASKLSGIQDGAEQNVQSDWNETNSSSDAYIKNKPTLPTVNDGVLTIKRNGTTVQTFSANQANSVNADITVPTKTSDITNDSNYVSDANYVHTDNNFTTTLKNKLNGIAEGAEVNQDAFSNVKVGSTTIQADSKTDTLELAAGTRITLTPDATNDKVTIATTAEVNQNAFSNVKVGSTTIAADTKTDTLELVAGDNVTLTPDSTNDKVTIASTDTQSDWNESDSSSPAYINNKPTIPTVNNATLTIQKNGTTVKTFTANASTNVTCNITVPTKTSDITNDSDYVSDASYVHTDNNFTTTLKNKLDGIAAGAEVNQNAFSNVKVGSTTVAADSKTDTLELAAGTNITLTPDATNDKVTIATSAEVNQNAFSNVKVGSTTVAADSKTDTLELVAGDHVTLTPDATNDKVTIASSWRGIQNNLTSDSTSDSLSAAQGKALANGSARDNTKLPLAGGTLTGRVTTTKAINDIITGSGTAARDAGSGASPRYFPALWKFNTGLTATNGDIIVIKVPVAGHDYGVFVSIDNGANYYPVSVNGTSRLTTHYPNAMYLTLIYDSSAQTNSVYPAAGGDAKINVTGGGWRVLNYYDSGNTYDRNRYTGTIKCGSTAIVAGNIIVGKDGVYHHLKDGTAFDITYPVLYANAALNANATGTNNYDIFHITITTTQSITLTAYKPVFIKGTLSGNLFTPDSTTPLTQTLPTSADGKYYMFLGMATGSTTLYLQEIHPIFAYKNGKFGEIVNDAMSVNGYTVAKSVPSNAVFTDTQSNWNETNTSSAAYIQNKPTIPTQTSQLTNDSNYVSDANYVHTDNNFTTTLKNKLNGIAEGAEVNQNAFSNVKVGSTTVVADSKTDTLELVAGTNITLTPDATNDKVTIATSAEVNQNAFSNVKVGSTTVAADSKTDTLELEAGTNITLTPDATNDKVTIATSAEVNQNAFSNVKVGSTTVAADSKTDTLELVAGSNITITPDATNDKITIAASDNNTHRPIQVNGTEILGNNTTALNLKAGSNMSITNSSGTVTFAATDTNNRKAFYGTCATAAATAAKEVTLSDNTGWELKAGTIVGVKFTNTNSASSVTLNVNGTGAKSIYYSNAVYTSTSTAVTGIANTIIYYMYDGTYWVWMGASRYWNDNTYDRNRFNAAIKCGTTAIVAANIIVGKDGVYHHLKDGTAFDISYPILYANGAIAANATGTNNYDILNFTVTTTQSITLTAYKPVYIKGTLSGSIFTPDSTAPLTQTIPTSADGKYYIFLGVATSTTAIYLTERHEIFAYKNGKFGQIVNDALSVNGYTVAKSVPSNAVFTDTQANWNETSSSSAAYIQNKPTIPTVNNSTITLKQGGVTKGSFTLNQASGATIDFDAGGGGATLEHVEGEIRPGSSWNSPIITWGSVGTGSITVDLNFDVTIIKDEYYFEETSPYAYSGKRAKYKFGIRCSKDKYLVSGSSLYNQAAAIGGVVHTNGQIAVAIADSGDNPIKFIKDTNALTEAVNDIPEPCEIQVFVYGSRTFWPATLAILPYVKLVSGSLVCTGYIVSLNTFNASYGPNQVFFSQVRLF